MSDSNEAVESGLPVAELRPARSRLLWWLLPLAALVLAGYLGFRVWVERGTVIVVQFENGYGLQQGDAVRYRGIVVGEVDEVALAASLDRVAVTLHLRSDAASLAMRGSQFWIVRPRVGPSGVSGLDTVVGPRYVSLRPGLSTDRRWFFVGREEPPLIDRGHEGDLEVIVQANSRGSLQAGGPVLYRQVRVGTVLSVGLASDGSAVEARVHIDAAYAPLVRRQTRFWDSGGVEIDAGITGISMDIDSLSSLVIGGVSFATPPEAGARVTTGHRFTLSVFDEEWMSWEPNVAIGNALLPPGAPLPTPLRATLRWEEGIFHTDEARSGWVLPVADGVMAPLDLIRPPDDARDDEATVELAGQSIRLPADIELLSNHLGRLPLDLKGVNPWRDERLRHPEEVEDCIIIADPSTRSAPLAAVRITPADDGWRIDDLVPIDESWHGGLVVSRRDGRIIGMLRIDDQGAFVALVPQGTGVASD